MKTLDRNRERAVLALLVVLDVALAGVALAQPVEREQVGVAFTGEVTAVDHDAKTVSVRGANGEKGVFQIAAETTVMSGDEEIGLEGLRKGQWISIDGRMHGESKIATYVEVVEDPTGGAAAKALPTRAGATIVIGNDSLAPTAVTIGAGQSVTFRNAGAKSDGQKVVAVDGSFSSPALAHGDAWSHSFDVPGVYPVEIEGHPAAKATIVVE